MQKNIMKKVNFSNVKTDIIKSINDCKTLKELEKLEKEALTDGEEKIENHRKFHKRDKEYIRELNKHEKWCKEKFPKIVKDRKDKISKENKKKLQESSLFF